MDGNSLSGKSESVNNGTCLKNCDAAIDSTDLKTQVAVIGQQLSSLQSALASLVQATTGKTDNLLTATQDGQDTTNAKKLHFYANVAATDLPSVLKTVVSHTMKEERNEERDRVSLAVYGLHENGRDMRDFENFLWELQCEVPIISVAWIGRFACQNSKDAKIRPVRLKLFYLLLTGMLSYLRSRHTTGNSSLVKSVSPLG